MYKSAGLCSKFLWIDYNESQRLYNGFTHKILRKIGVRVSDLEGSLARVIPGENDDPQNLQ